MSPSVEIVQGIKDEGEGPEPFDIELCILDVGMVSLELDRGVEYVRCVPSNLLCGQRYPNGDLDYLPEPLIS
jgi:hypothetical protein